MDFSLIRKNENFDIESYFPSIVEEFKAAGRSVIITRKEKKQVAKVIINAIFVYDSLFYAS